MGDGESDFRGGASRLVSILGPLLVAVRTGLKFDCVAVNVEPVDAAVEVERAPHILAISIRLSGMVGEGCLGVIVRMAIQHRRSRSFS